MSIFRYPPYVVQDGMSAEERRHVLVMGEIMRRFKANPEDGMARIKLGGGGFDYEQIAEKLAATGKLGGSGKSKSSSEPRRHRGRGLREHEPLETSGQIRPGFTKDWWNTAYREKPAPASFSEQPIPVVQDNQPKPSETMPDYSQDEQCRDCKWRWTPEIRRLWERHGGWCYSFSDRHSVCSQREVGEL